MPVYFFLMVRLSAHADTPFGARLSAHADTPRRRVYFAPLRLDPTRLSRQLKIIIKRLSPHPRSHAPVTTTPTAFDIPIYRAQYASPIHPHDAQLKIIVLLWYVRILRSMCFATARDNTIFSKSRPLDTNISGVSRCVIRTTSCSIIGPASKSAVM